MLKERVSQLKAVLVSGSSFMDTTPQDSEGEGSRTRHETLWFFDGNVVLIAEDVEFKLHQGVLARQSSVFGDMFIASDPDSCEQIDNCPVVKLQDSPLDLAIFLEVVYDGFQYVTPLSCGSILIQLSSIIA